MWLALIMLSFAGCRATPTAVNGSDLSLAEQVLRGGRAASNAWPGYDALDAPILLVHQGKAGILITHEKPPPGYARVRPGVFVTTTPPEIPDVFLRSFSIGGVPGTVLKFTASNPGPVVGVAMVIHEHFHDYQETWKARILDLPYAVEDAQDLSLAQMEQESLARWLEFNRDDDVRNFLALRASRYRRFPVAQVERDRERDEGTARFVDYQARSAAFGPNEFLPDLIAKLKSPLTPGTMGELRSYATGAALCYVLHKLQVPGWQSEIEKGDGPYDILAKLYPITRTEAQRRLEAIMSSTDYHEASRDARREIQQEGQKLRVELQRFEDRSKLRVHLRFSSLRPADGFSASYFSTTADARLPSGDKLIHAQDFHFDARGWRGDISNRAVLYGEDLDVMVSSACAISLDGKAWRPVTGSRPFQELRLTDTGVRLEVRGARARYDGRMLDISR